MISVKMKLTGSQNVLDQLKKMSKTDIDLYTGEVGYSAPYAIYVHEDMQANHPNGGQAKFLEQPAKSMKRQMGQMLVAAMKRGKPFRWALFEVLTYLKQASQALCPYRTGFLRRSAYVKVEKKV